MTPGSIDPAVEVTGNGPVTVVIAQRVKLGQEAAVRRWQDDINGTVAQFPGYLGNEVTAFGPQGGEWAVIYRFDSMPHLDSWLASPERVGILSRGEDLFEGPASQYVFVREHDEGLVTVVVAHAIDASQEEAFLAWQERVTDAERRFPGFRGSELFRPVPGVQEEWTIMYRFDSDEHVTAWLESPERTRLLNESDQFQDFELRRIASPFGSWFSQIEQNGEGAPAQWKTAISVLIGLYPTVVLLTLAISHIWKSGKLWETILVSNVCSVSLLTWVVMPVVTRALRFWLTPTPDRVGLRLDVIGTAVSISIVTFIAFVLWLITTQIWNLP
jgi:antibiotic biosynthesis monooxygenase (ABM) superfamily enzyme